MTLLEWLNFAGLSQSDLARALGVRKQSVHSWLKGKACPSGGYAIEIERLSEGRVRAISIISTAKRGER